VKPNTKEIAMNNLNIVTTIKTFKIAGSEFTITRTRPTKKAKAVAKVDRYFAKHVPTR